MPDVRFSIPLIASGFRSSWHGSARNTASAANTRTPANIKNCSRSLGRSRSSHCSNCEQSTLAHPLTVQAVKIVDAFFRLHAEASAVKAARMQVAVDDFANSPIFQLDFIAEFHCALWHLCR